MLVIVFFIFLPTTINEETIFSYKDNFIYSKFVEELKPTLGMIVASQIEETLTIGAPVASQSEINYYNTQTCNCIDFIKQFFPELKDKILETPKSLWGNYEKFGLEKSEFPKVGYLIITRDHESCWHAAYIIKVIEDDKIEILEKNFKPCQITRRIFEIDDGRIVGYLK